MSPRRSRRSALALAVGTVAAGTGLVAALVGLRRRPLDVVPGFEISRYLGTWYEIARMPLRFERGCHDVTAHYGLRADGTVRVVNRCCRAGRVSEVRGRAWPRDASQPARLTVQFQWPFRGDYEVLWIDPSYRVAVVGTRDRRHAWVLAREPTLDDRTFGLCRDVLAEQGFATRRLIRTEHRLGTAPTDRSAPRRTPAWHA